MLKPPPPPFYHKHTKQDLPSTDKRRHVTGNATHVIAALRQVSVIPKKVVDFVLVSRDIWHPCLFLCSFSGAVWGTGCACVNGGRHPGHRRVAAGERDFAGKVSIFMPFSEGVGVEAWACVYTFRPPQSPSARSPRTFLSTRRRGSLALISLFNTIDNRGCPAGRWSRAARGSRRFRQRYVCPKLQPRDEEC